MTVDPARVATASQTVGPFFHLGLEPPAGTETVGPVSDAERMRIAVSVVDGDGRPVDDALVEIWHMAASGGGAARVAHYGRWPTDGEGRCEFETPRPAGTPDGRGGVQAPHINVCLFARGLLRPVYTRIYFAGDPALAGDPVLALVPAGRRDTLMASPDPERPGRWRFDIRLQGPRETVFFDL
ncbi:MAG TPA: protocatechuate 3,4-dioxygenase subunit alpha [Vicinamibacterales bacterium]|nr:protocatechuate 3,4-dioxygenase subunit alpha [Vicinamibacterales bacterium]